MKTYQHTQRAGVIIVGPTIVCLMLAVASIFRPPLIFGAIAGIIVAYSFRSMTIEISDTELTWYFGSGVSRKRVAIGEVTTAELVRTHFWNGWGIHYTSRGWLYNASGYGAVCVTLRNGRRFCLGSDEPEVLARELARNR